MRQEHIPVLLQPVIEGLRVMPGKKFIDATFGLGGHSKEIARLGGIVLGIERDPETIAKLRVKSYELRVGNITIRQGNFRNIRMIAQEEGFTRVDGILFDLGYSSWQLDKSGRGFSFSKDEKLDMRYDPEKQELTAALLVNKTSRDELVDIISKYGEEELSGTIVDNIIRFRPFRTTGELVLAIETTLRGPDKVRHLARVFQALRIAVNDEMGSLKEALPQAVSLLVPGGRIGVISFHSLEDRIVKQFLKEQKTLKVITKKPIIASEEEIRTNTRSRSAKLRIGEKI